MKSSLLLTLMIALIAGIFGISGTRAEEEAVPARCYELRTYFAATGKLDALHQRFREHTQRIFTRHGITQIGYWTPKDNPQSKLIYLLSYADPAAREAAWKAFQEDPEWIAVKNASEADGKLVERIESRMLTLTDFSPLPKEDPTGNHLFEMRTYTASEGNLPLLLDRFRQHTLKLFTRHGMEHLAYFTPATGQSGEKDTLIYFLMHKSEAAQKTSFEAFRADPEWIGVKQASEKAGGGSLTVDDGVKSELLIATDYSPVK